MLLRPFQQLNHKKSIRKSAACDQLPLLGVRDSEIALGLIFSKRGLKQPCAQTTLCFFQPAGIVLFLCWELQGGGHAACWAWLCGLRVTGLERIKTQTLEPVNQSSTFKPDAWLSESAVQEGWRNQIPWVLKKVLITRGAGSVPGKMISGAEIRLALLALHGLFHTALLSLGSC